MPATKFLRSREFAMLQNVYIFVEAVLLDCYLATKVFVDQFDMLLDPMTSEHLILGGTHGSAQWALKERLLEPGRFPITTSVVVVKPEYIRIDQQYSDDDERRSAQNLVAWMFEKYQCRLKDEYGKDWTDVYLAQDLDAIFGADAQLGKRAPLLGAPSTKQPTSMSLIPGEDRPPFDANMIHKRLVAQFESLVDPLGTDTIMLCGLREHREIYRQHRLQDPFRFPACPTARIEPHCLHITLADVDVNRERSARNLILWMQHEYPTCCILDAEGDDVTQRCYTEGTNLLFDTVR
jgi:hypothetical protein